MWNVRTSLKRCGQHRKRICYRKIKPPAARQKSSVEHYNLADDENYHVPGQMELSEFIDMPEVSEEKVND